MARSRTQYVCSECGASFGRWSGRCPNCEAWDSLEEHVQEDRPSGLGPGVVAATPRLLSDVDLRTEPRFSTRIAELDRVLGGGVLPGGTVLVGGDPGIGKSTVLLQALGAMAAGGAGCLYVTCEESLGQIRLRAERLGVADTPMRCLAETSLEAVCGCLAEEGPGIVVVDSVQMVTSERVDSSPGSVSQLRAVAHELVRMAKRDGFALFLVGHVTKQGVLAGPKVLEHMVDTVLYFESDRFHALRILRATKNRFGSTGEIGVFQMTEAGLRDVPNPSELFLAERDAEQSGSVVTSTIEGNRALLVEIQALVAPSSYGTPERKMSGVDGRRVSMLLSVLERRAGQSLSGCDVFVNVAGGVRVAEPAADLPIALAIAGSNREAVLPGRTVAVGEIGLGGEVRGVSQMGRRLQEARKLGFERAVVPSRGEKAAREAGLQVEAVRHLRQAVALLR